MGVERKRYMWGSMVESRRYDWVEGFEKAVKSAYDLDLCSLVSQVIPKVSDSAEFQSDVMIYFTSEFANSFRIAPIDLTLKDPMLTIDMGPVIDAYNAVGTTTPNDSKEKDITNDPVPR